MTHLLADENFPGPSVRKLREAGQSVDWVAEVAPGASDAEVLLSLFAFEGIELVGRYTVVERARVRQRPLLRST